jgi:hypothetical protein
VTGADPGGRAPVGALGIVVVYFLKDDEDLPLLRVHFDRIARHTTVPYRVYAAAHRVPPEARRLIESRSDVEVVDVGSTELRGSREHAWYLDRLVAHARRRDVTHVCTLDVDSFPVRDGWVEVLDALAPPESGLAGILRLENGDVCLPHPSCVFAPRGFYERFDPSFSPDSDGSAEFRRFLRTTGQRADTGIHLAYALWAHRLPWGRMLRTNVADPDGLMAGVYADAVFHLGGVGRGKLFRRDLDQSFVHRVTRPLERLPLPGEALGRARKAALRTLRGRTDARLAARNRQAYEELRGALFADSDAFLARLRGGAPST